VNVRVEKATKNSRLATGGGGERINYAYLIEEDLVVDLLFQLSFGPFLRKELMIK
jgi:hypothetical protein